MNFYLMYNLIPKIIKTRIVYFLINKIYYKKSKYTTS